MKVLFLDFDGVLNSSPFREKIGGIDEKHIPVLGKIIAQTNAKVVLITTWRNHWDEQGHPLDETGFRLEKQFREAGFSVFGRTGFGTDRAEEVSNWLNAHPETENYGILDDGYFGGNAFLGHTVHPKDEVGLTEEDARQMIKILQ